MNPQSCEFTVAYPILDNIMIYVAVFLEGVYHVCLFDHMQRCKAKNRASKFLAGPVILQPHWPGPGKGIRSQSLPEPDTLCLNQTATLTQRPR